MLDVELVAWLGAWAGPARSGIVGRQSDGTISRPPIRCSWLPPLAAPCSRGWLNGCESRIETGPEQWFIDASAIHAPDSDSINKGEMTKSLMSQHSQSAEIAPLKSTAQGSLAALQPFLFGCRKAARCGLARHGQALGGR